MENISTIDISMIVYILDNKDATDSWQVKS